MVWQAEISIHLCLLINVQNNLQNSSQLTYILFREVSNDFAIL